jgi:hypothetical protein
MDETQRKITMRNEIDFTSTHLMEKYLPPEYLSIDLVVLRDCPCIQKVPHSSGSSRGSRI